MESLGLPASPIQVLAPRYVPPPPPAPLDKYVLRSEYDDLKAHVFRLEHVIASMAPPGALAHLHPAHPQPHLIQYPPHIPLQYNHAASPGGSGGKPSDGGAAPLPPQGMYVPMGGYHTVPIGMAMMGLPPPPNANGGAYLAPHGYQPYAPMPAQPPPNPKKVRRKQQQSTNANGSGTLPTPVSPAQGSRAPPTPTAPSAARRAAVAVLSSPAPPTQAQTQAQVQSLTKEKEKVGPSAQSQSGRQGDYSNLPSDSNLDPPQDRAQHDPHRPNHALALDVTFHNPTAVATPAPKNAHPFPQTLPPRPRVGPSTAQRSEAPQPPPIATVNDDDDDDDDEEEEEEEEAGDDAQDGEGEGFAEDEPPMGGMMHNRPERIAS